MVFCGEGRERGLEVSLNPFVFNSGSHQISHTGLHCVKVYHSLGILKFNFQKWIFDLSSWRNRKGVIGVESGGGDLDGISSKHRLSTSLSVSILAPIPGCCGIWYLRMSHSGFCVKNHLASFNVCLTLTFIYYNFLHFVNSVTTLPSILLGFFWKCALSTRI